MTTNVGVVTSNAVVLGCDSIASASTHYLDPFAMDWEKDGNGNFVEDANGKYTLKFDAGDFKSVVTDSWGGVQKMFEIHPAPAPMVAVTAGLAKMRERPIASWANDFYRRQEAVRFEERMTDCPAIVDAFKTFMRERYEEQYKDSKLPETLRDGPSFLIGGYGLNDMMGRMYRLRVQENSVDEFYGPPPNQDQSGICWNAQSDAIERFVRGYDSEFRKYVEGEVRAKLGGHDKTMNEYVTGVINDVLARLNQTMPEGVEINVPKPDGIALDWQRYRTRISYSNLPIQEAINLTAFLVNLQSGRSRFGRGVATVGGRTHVGIITKDKGFKVLNEPDLVHRYTGFADDH